MPTLPRLPRGLSFDSESPLSDRPFKVYSRASKSFENLIALANDQERWEDVQKVAKKAVWRDVGEPPIPLDTFRLCIEHASWGALSLFLSSDSVS